MATMLHQYGTTTQRRSQFDLRAPFRAALNAVMQAAQMVNGTDVDAETAAQDGRRQRTWDRESAQVMHERHHHIA
jgi:hypothetical protein